LPTLTIPASLDQLARVHDWAKQVLAGIPDAERYNVLLALSEAVTNAIRHGCKEDAERAVSISIANDARGLTIAVEDDGDGFSPDSIPDPTQGAALYQAGGRGIYLLKALASEVQFNSTQQGTTVVVRFVR
jgi:serine/threonine-protein kinase RsbW